MAQTINSNDTCSSFLIIQYTTSMYTISQINEFTEAYRSGPWLSGTLTVAWYWVGEHQAGPGRAHRPGRAISE